MTRQTSEPVDHLSMHASGRSMQDLIHFHDEGLLTWDTPYQRGAVWTEDQRVQLIYSALAGLPIPAIIMNERPWIAVDEPCYAVIDGKQRMMAFHAWYSDALAVPASWFPAEHVAQAEDTDDGPYVRRSGLTVIGRRIANNRFVLPVATAHLDDVAAEAAVYLRVNGFGTPQTDEDMNRAARIAERDA